MLKFRQFLNASHEVEFYYIFFSFLGLLSLENAVLVHRLLPNIFSNFSDCVSMARNKFEKYFNHKARQLLTNFPSEAVNRDGNPFWEYPKRLPRPIVFDAEDDDHFMFVVGLAKAWANICDVQVGVC